MTNMKRLFTLSVLLLLLPITCPGQTSTGAKDARIKDLVENIAQ